MKTTFAVAVAALFAAAPAFAQQDYQTSPALQLNDHSVAVDTGSAQYPRFNGQPTTAESETIIAPSASEAGVESLNSLPAALGANPAAPHR